jgi:hypothetical protein
MMSPRLFRSLQAALYLRRDEALCVCPLATISFFLGIAAFCLFLSQISGWSSLVPIIQLALSSSMLFQMVLCPSAVRMMFASSRLMPIFSARAASGSSSSRVVWLTGASIADPGGVRQKVCQTPSIRYYVASTTTRLFVGAVPFITFVPCISAGEHWNGSLACYWRTAREAS